MRRFLVFIGLLLTAVAPEVCHGRLLWEDTLKGASLGEVTGGGFLSTPGGQGWAPGNRKDHPGPSFSRPDAISYPLAKGENFNPDAGALRLRMRYRGGLTDYQARIWSSTLVDFIGPGDTTSVLVYAEWQGHEDVSHLNMVGFEYQEDVFGFFIPLGWKVKPGDIVDLAISWGPDPVKDNRIYVNGREIRAFLDGGKKPAKVRESTFARYLAKVGKMRLGIDSGDGGVYPAGRAPAVDTIFELVQLYDQPMTPADLGMLPTIGSVSDDTFGVTGISGKLVAGDKVTVTLVAQTGGKASFDMGMMKDIPMEEVPPREAAPGAPAVAPGTYRGAYTILPGNDYENGQVTGRFVSSDNVAAEAVLSASRWNIDTKPSVTFKIDRKDLPADSSAKARIKLAAKDANGNPVKGRHLKLTLATTDEYTGTVGAGDFGKEVGATVETRWKGETDSWGEVEFDYTAGFAAKTVILTAKDLDSGGVTVDYITAFKEASIDIALTPPVSRAAARRGLQYTLKVEASRTELTADGRSRSVIRATLMDPNGTPVAGDPVMFTLSSPNGTLRTIAGTTDSSGTATAEYTAGKKIGIVVVTATATLRNATGNVSIILMSDAPAKIYLKARPETLPADGFSRADLSVKVTDINDNPNKDTKVEFKIARGGGKLEYTDRVTDRFGDAQNRYSAGNLPGIASVAATVRSKIPTEAELAKARGVLFAPYSADSDSIRVEKWFKRKGDSFLKGEVLVEYTVGRGATVYRIPAPYDGTLGEIFVEYWDRAEVGQTLVILIPAARP